MARKIKIEKRARKVPFTKREQLDVELYRMKRGNDSAFPRVVEYFEQLKRIKKHCARKGTRFNLIVLDGDDLYQIALTTIWESVQKFKFICPKCDARFKTNREFLDHQFKIHGEVGCAPRVSIGDYVAMMAYNEMRNAIRKERARKRNLLLGDAISIDEMNDNIIEDDSCRSLKYKNVELAIATESEIESLMRVAELLTFARDELDERSVLVLKMFAGGFTKNEIAITMVRSGMSKKVHSARVSINRILQRRADYALKFIGA